MKLQEKIAIVTGAGSEMGSAITIAFAVEGAKVVAVDADAQCVFDKRQAVGDVPGEIYPQGADLTRPENVHWLMEETYNRFGRLDILVNCAGTIEPQDITGDTGWRKVMDIQLIAAMELSSQALRRMIEQEDGGCVINVTPVVDKTRGKENVLQSVCAYGLVGMTRGIGQQYAGRGIRCNAICPGNVETSDNVTIKLPPEWAPIRTPGNIRRGSPEEIAAAALFLAGEGASFVNGAALVVNGGAV